MKWRRPFVVFVAAVGVAGGATCGGGADRPPASEPPASPGTTTNQTNLMPRDRVQDGGRLTWAINAMPVNFNYGEIDGTDKDTHDIIAAILPSAFSTDAGGTPHWNRDLLASEPAMTVDPKQVVTYRINPKAAWYDGTPITWADFQSQWKAQNGSNKAFRIASSNGYADVESVERGRDDREVVVTFKSRFADWQSIFYPVYPASTTRDPRIFNDGWKERPLTTAGPFKLQSIDRATQTITFVRNEKWWGDPAKLDAIVFRTIVPDAQIDALANGEIDFMDIGPDANKYQRARAIAGVEIRVAGGPNFRHLTINGTSPNLQDVRVRQALAMGIDRAAIARALLGPLGGDPTPLENHIFMANQAGYRNNSGEVGQYNPDRAGQLLDEAGWKIDGAVRRKAGRPLEITMVIPAAVATSRQESELMQNMLSRIGVTLRINTVPVGDFFDKYIRPGQFDFTVFSWIGTPFPISSSRSIYAQPTKNARGELDIQQNYARVGTDAIDALYAQANAELDPAKAVELANRLDALIWQHVHSLTLYQRPELIATKRNLANFGAFGFQQPPIYQDIGWVKP
jgi:peptide/nickel transport system substrate-binding protein